jgi:hypothetical protein
VVPAPTPSAADERRLIEEIDMLTRARAEAEDRRREAEERRAADETDQQARADAEQAAMDATARAAELEEARAAATAAAARQAEAERREKARAEETAALERKRTEEAEEARLVAEREAEADRIDEALRQARAARDARRATAETPPTAPERRQIEPAVVAADPRPAIDDTGDRTSTRVTVLLLMEPGDRGIRRHKKTADPVLCGERGCYIGSGSASVADLLPTRRALGAGRTLGDRAGACSNALGCVYRGVDLLAYPAVLQPIDMRLVRHDRREPQVLHEASDCRRTVTGLACTTLEGPDYRMWIVPEHLAEAAGPEALLAALRDGLPSAAR